MHHSRPAGLCIVHRRCSGASNIDMHDVPFVALSFHGQGVVSASNASVLALASAALPVD